MHLVGVSLVYFWDKKSNLHSAKSQNHENRKLRSLVHVELPDNEGWQNTECPIRPTTDGRVRVNRFNGDARVNAVSLHSSVLAPEVGDGPALENEKEEEVSAHQSGYGHDNVDNGTLGFVDGDS